MDEREAGTIFRDTLSILTMGREGAWTDTLPDLPGGDAYVSDFGPIFGLRLGRISAMAVSPREIFYGAQDAGGIRRIAPDLTTVGIIQPLGAPEPVTEAVTEAWEASKDTRMPPDGLIGATGAAYPDTLPTYRDLVAGREGWLWVQDPVRPGP